MRSSPSAFDSNHSVSSMTGVKCARELSPFPAPSCVNSPDSRKTSQLFVDGRRGISLTLVAAAGC